MNISLVVDEDRSAWVKASHEDGTPDRLLIESSPDLLDWEEEMPTSSTGTNVLEAVRAFDAEGRFDRVRKVAP